MINPYYQDDHVTIYHCDCREILPELDKVDLVLTDPPYGIKRDKGFEGFGGFGTPIKRRRYESDNWDSNRPEKQCFDIILSKAKNCRRNHE